jgi:predicted nucleotidyltransferase
MLHLAHLCYIERAMLFRNSVISLLNSPLKLKIISFLIKKDVLMSEREISRLLDVSHMSINRTMQELEGINFVHPGRVGRAHVWKVNRRSYAYQIYSRVIESLKDINSPLDDLKATILANLPLPAIEKLVLFGSVAKQDERPDSDIDIFILVKDESAMAETRTAVEALSLVCLERFGNTLSPYILTQKGLREKEGLKLLSEIDSGIVLHQRNAGDVF